MLSFVVRGFARLVLLLAPLAVVLVPASASAGPAPRRATADVTLTLTKQGTGSGSVTSSPVGIDCGSTCSYDFPVGTQVTLTATPAVGSSFNGWVSTAVPPSSPPCSGQSPTCTFTLNQAESIKATFDETMESVSVSNAPQPNSSGTITISGPGTQLVAEAGQQRQAWFAYGSTVTITAAAAAGSSFTGWSGDCSGIGSCVIVATRSFLVQGSFAVSEKLEVQLTGKGSGTVTSTPAGLVDCPSTCSGAWGAGAPLTLTATPSPGSYFADWSVSGGCGGSTSPCTFDMPFADDIEVAVFRLDHCLVPNVERLPLSRAKASLSAYSCRPGRTTRAFSRHVRKGAVISQRPRPGSRLKLDGKVNLVLSRGRRR